MTHLGEQVGEVEDNVVQTGELEVEQLDSPAIEQHHVAVVGVVMAEHRRLIGQAPHHLLDRRLAVNLG